MMLQRIEPWVSMTPWARPGARGMMMQQASLRFCARMRSLDLGGQDRIGEAAVCIEPNQRPARGSAEAQALRELEILHRDHEIQFLGLDRRRQNRA